MRAVLPLVVAVSLMLLFVSSPVVEGKRGEEKVPKNQAKRTASPKGGKLRECLGQAAETAGEH